MLVRVLTIHNGRVHQLDITEKQLAKLATIGAVIAVTGSPTPVLAAAAGAAVPAAASTGADIASKVNKASQPIKDLLVGIADPVCYIVFTWGLLECMLGKASSGINRIKFAALGYAAMNWMPILMEIIRNAKP